jgi:hypothetical protein
MAKSDGRNVYTATIAAAGSLSAAVPIGSDTLLGVMPGLGSGAFDANTATLLFHVSMDNVTYTPLRDKDGSVVYVTVAQNNTYGAMPLDPTEFAAWRFVKVGTYKADKSTVQTQTAETDITLIGGKVV